MEPKKHIARAVILFDAGHLHYWAKPSRAQTLEQLQKSLSNINRYHQYGFRFNIDKNAVMISAPKYINPKMQKNTATIIFPDVEKGNLRALAANVILQAIKDAFDSKDIFNQLDAVIWIASDDFAIWSDWAEIRNNGGVDLLVSGRLRNIVTGETNAKTHERTDLLRLFYGLSEQKAKETVKTLKIILSLPRSEAKDRLESLLYE